MKRLFTLLLTLSILLLCCSCTGQKQSKNSLYGTWELTGLKEYASNDANSTIEISKTEVSFTTGGETMGPYEYVESHDGQYTYLEIDDESMPVVLVQVNKDMLVLFFTAEENGYGAYSGVTPWGVEYDAEADWMNIFMKKGSGTTKLPDYLVLDQLEKHTDYGNYREYLYYPDSHILHLAAGGFASFYAFEGGGVEFIESITLFNSTIDSYSDLIITDHNFIITDNT